jgi:hypothetical protein
MAENRAEGDEILTVRQVSDLLKLQQENDLQACAEWLIPEAGRQELGVFEVRDNEALRRRNSSAQESNR